MTTPKHGSGEGGDQKPPAQPPAAPGGGDQSEDQGKAPEQAKGPGEGDQGQAGADDLKPGGTHQTVNESETREVHMAKRAARFKAVLDTVVDKVEPMRSRRDGFMEFMQGLIADMAEPQDVGDVPELAALQDDLDRVWQAIDRNATH